MSTHSPSVADALDRTVAEFADRLARDEEPRREELLARHPEHREELSRLFRMIEAGLADQPAPVDVLRSGARLGEFEIEEELGRGGTSVVYRAVQTSLGRPVALKVLRPHLTVDGRHVDRFRREARAAARLRHENLVRVLAVGYEAGHHFLAMELVGGPSLGEVLRRLRALPSRPTPADLARETGDASPAAVPSYPAAAARWFAGVLRGVEAAHEAGILHRDLKPSNVLIDEHGVPKVADFGLAKGATDLGLSLTGELLGTPHYMAPEQASAARESIGRPTDVYALGATLYELLLLRRPFEGDSMPAVLSSILHREPPAPRAVDPDLPAQLEAVVLRAMAKDPGRRYATVAELAADLARAVEGLPVTAPTRAGLTGVLSSYFEARTRGLPFEHVSPRRFLGLPLLHVALGVRDPATGRPRVALGWVACGDVAVGAYAVGYAAAGVLTLAVFGVGLISIGLAVAGAYATGGAALGWEARGALAAGYRAEGAMGTISATPPERGAGRSDGWPFDGAEDVFVAGIATLVLPLVLTAFLHARVRDEEDRRLVRRTAWIGTPLLMAAMVVLHRLGVVPFWAFLLLSWLAAGALARGLVRRLKGRGALR